MRNSLPPLPALAVEEPTLALTCPIRVDGANAVTVADLVNLLRDGIPHMTTGDLTRIILLCGLAWREKRHRLNQERAAYRRAYRDK